MATEDSFTTGGLTKGEFVSEFLVNEKIDGVLRTRAVDYSKAAQQLAATGAVADRLAAAALGIKVNATDYPELAGKLGYEAGVYARVLTGPTGAAAPAKGIYEKTGAVGTGGWTWKGPPDVSSEDVAAAKNRANHTGTQAPETVTGLPAALADVAASKTKLAGIASGATANATDAQLRDRGTHTGSQPKSSITGLTDDLAGIAAALAERAAIYADLAVDARDRPGVSPLLFTSQLTGDPKAAPPIAKGVLAVNADPNLGPVLRLRGEDADPNTGYRDVATRRLIIYRPGRTYAVVFAAARAQNPTDPENNAVELRLQNLSTNWGDINTPRLGPALPLLTTDSQRFFTFLVGKEGSPGTLNYVVPASVHASRPFVRVYGVGQQTDVALIGFYDVTDQVSGGVDVSALQQAIASESLTRSQQYQALTAAISGFQNDLGAVNGNVAALGLRVVDAEEAAAAVSLALSTIDVNVSALRAVFRQPNAAYFGVSAEPGGPTYFYVTPTELEHEVIYAQDQRLKTLELAALPALVKRTAGDALSAVDDAGNSHWEMRPDGLFLDGLPYGGDSAQAAATQSRVARIDKRKFEIYGARYVDRSLLDFRICHVLAGKDSQTTGTADQSVIDSLTTAGIKMFGAGIVAGYLSSGLDAFLDAYETATSAGGAPRGETGLMQMARQMLIEMQARGVDFVGSGRQILISSFGVNGQSLAAFMGNAQNQLDRFEQQVRRGKINADALYPNVPDPWRNYCVAGVHLTFGGTEVGEGLSKAEIKKRVRWVIEQIQRIVREVMGNPRWRFPVTTNVLCHDQFYSPGNPLPLISQVVLELSNEMLDFIATAPDYITPYYTLNGVWNAHNVAVGNRIKFAYAARAVMMFHFDGVKHRCCEVRDVVVEGQSASIGIYCPVGKLVRDTSWVTDPGNYGLAAVNVNRQPLALSNVAIDQFAADGVRFDFTGEFAAFRVAYGNGSAGGLGPTAGPRACFHDSAGGTVDIGNGQTFTLNNYVLPGEYAAAAA